MAKNQSAAASQRTLDLLVEAWRQGFAGTKRVGFDEYKKANTFRLRLYIAVRKYRKDESLDPELSRLLGCMEAVIEEEAGRHYVVIRKVEDNLELARIAAELGIPWGFEADAMESLKRIQESLGDLIETDTKTETQLNETLLNQGDLYDD